jgi:hypothetical protein
MAVAQKVRRCACGCGKRIRRDNESGYSKRCLTGRRVWYAANREKVVAAQRAQRYGQKKLCACGCGLETYAVYRPGHKPSRQPIALARPTQRDLGWAAGFLEGEGSFAANSGTQLATASQVQTEPLNMLQRFFGGSVRPHARNSQRNPNWQDAFSWCVVGARARGVMLTLYVLMSPKRQAQIRKALAA